MISSILIVGTGAMANLFAARLAAIGVHVTMLGSWTDGIAALNEYGVRMLDAEGEEHSYLVKATDDPVKCAHTTYALVLVKAWQTERAAQQLERCLTLGALALTLQNGLGNYETLAERLGSERVALGVTTTGATLLGPGRLRPGGDGRISIGQHHRLEPLAQLLERAGFELEVRQNIEGLLWGKLVVNAAINPLTALLSVPNGELLQRPAARQLAATLGREAAAVAAAKGVQLPFDDPVAAIEDVARRTAGNYSSMLQDALRQAPTEIDAICGAVVRQGAELGVPTPANDTVWRLVTALIEGEDSTSLN